MEKQKEDLINNLRKKGVSVEIIDAFTSAKRENFIPERLNSYAYDDIALPLEDGSQISQPTTIAFMLELLELRPGLKVLELGSGCGYALELISYIVKNGKVYGVEISKDLAIKSKRNLSDKENIDIINKDAAYGAPQYAPFERILVSFSCPDMRLPSIFVDQLTEGGILVVPVRESVFQLKKNEGKITTTEFPGFAFVPFKDQVNTWF